MEQKKKDDTYRDLRQTQAHACSDAQARPSVQTDRRSEISQRKVLATVGIEPPNDPRGCSQTAVFKLFLHSNKILNAEAVAVRGEKRFADVGGGSNEERGMPRDIFCGPSSSSLCA